MSMITVKNLRKSFGSLEVLKDINAEVKEKEIVEIQRRIEAFRNGKPLPEIKDRTVILVDDGIATGATLFAAIGMCRKNGAGKIVVAAPVASAKMEEELWKRADDVLILVKPEYFQAVSQEYESFGNLTDEETLSFVARWQKEYTPGKLPIGYKI